MTKYVEKPRIVEAIQLSNANRKEVEQFVACHGKPEFVQTDYSFDAQGEEKPFNQCIVRGDSFLVGDLIFNHGMWIVKYDNNQLEDLVPEEFHARFQKSE